MDGKLTERAFRCIFLLIFLSSIEARNGPMNSRCPTSQQPTNVARRCPRGGTAGGPPQRSGAPPTVPPRGTLVRVDGATNGCWWAFRVGC